MFRNFGGDPILDAELKNEGYSPNDEDFYDEIDKRMYEHFKDRFERYYSMEN